MENSYTSYNCYYNRSKPFTKETTSSYTNYPKNRFKEDPYYNNFLNDYNHPKDHNHIDYNCFTENCSCHDISNPCCKIETCHHNLNCRLVEETSYLDCCYKPNGSRVFPTALAKNITFFIHNIGCTDALVILQVTPDNRLFANDFDTPITISPKKTLALVPAIFAKFTRILGWTSDSNNFTTLLIYYQGLI